MKSVILPIAIVVCFFIFSCNKRARCNGTVLSPHEIPMPNVLLHIRSGLGGREIDNVFEVTTDINGHFDFDQKMNRRKHLDVIDIITNDSGSVSYYLNGDGFMYNNLVITLKK